MTKKTDVAIVENVEYPAIVGSKEFAAVLAENLAGDDFGAFDLERIKIPAGGGQLWEVVSDGVVKAVEELRGIIVFQQMVRSYWEHESDDAIDSPPDCMSNDCLTGTGNPGGECKTCPFAEFGSSQKGEGQACKLMRRLFLLRPGMMLPAMLNLPPTSLKPAKEFMLGLASRCRPYYSVEVGISLVSDKNALGKKYSRASFRTIRLLSPEGLKQVKALNESFAKSFA